MTEDQRKNVVVAIDDLKASANKLDFETIKTIRRIEREAKGRVCNDDITFAGRKDVLLMGEEQLVYMLDRNSRDELIFYCFDRYMEVPEVLTSGINPITQKPLTEEQRQFLESELKNSPYPKIDVYPLPEEIEERLLGERVIYTEAEYKVAMRELADKIREVGLNY